MVRLINWLMVALSLAVVVAYYAAWWRPVFPWFALVQLAWCATLLWRDRGRGPYSVPEDRFRGR